MLTLEIYNTNSFVIRGDSTYKYKENLKEKGGKYNSKLAGGPGWVFRIGFKDELQAFVDKANDGSVEAIAFEAKGTGNLPPTNGPSVEKELQSLRRDYDRLMDMYRILDNKLNQLTMSTSAPPQPQHVQKNHTLDTSWSHDEDKMPEKPAGRKKRFL